MSFNDRDRFGVSTDFDFGRKKVEFRQKKGIGQDHWQPQQQQQQHGQHCATFKWAALPDVVKHQL